MTEAFAWLRPFAVTGAFVDELPFGSTTAALGLNAPSGKLQSTLVGDQRTFSKGRGE